MNSPSPGIQNLLREYVEIALSGFIENGPKSAEMEDLFRVLGLGNRRKVKSNIKLVASDMAKWLFDSEQDLTTLANLPPSDFGQILLEFYNSRNDNNA